MKTPDLYIEGNKYGKIDLTNGEIGEALHDIKKIIEKK